MATPTEHAQKWIWFLDVVFGAVVALGIEKYEPVIRAAWLDGACSFALSLFVGISIFSFVAYDVVVYHKLAEKYPYCLTALGFVRFYLDLVMAFLLYVLLVNALQAEPDWFAILVTVSIWHVAAVAWHLIARIEHKVSGGLGRAILPHVLAIAIYWVVVFLAGAFGTKVMGLDDAGLSTYKLFLAAAMILTVSIFRWNQVFREQQA